jgi:hypothetical protein
MMWLLRDLRILAVSLWRVARGAADPSPWSSEVSKMPRLEPEPEVERVETRIGLIVTGPVHCTFCEHRGTALIPLGEVARDPRRVIVRGLVCPLCRHRSVISD